MATPPASAHATTLHLQNRTPTMHVPIAHFMGRDIEVIADTTQVLWGECISGALYIEDFKRLAQQVGFADARVLSTDPIQVTDPELKEVTGEAKFYSITYRCAFAAC